MNIDNLSKINGFDEYGNRYRFDPSTNNVYMIQSNESSERNIGSFRVKDNEIHYIKREQESQRMRIFDAWSINLHVAKYSDYIYFLTNKEGYKISFVDAMSNKKDTYKITLTEPKIFVPVKYWTKRSEIKK